MTIYDDMRGYVHTHDRNGWFDVATETTPMYQMIDKADAENAKLRNALAHAFESECAAKPNDCKWCATMCAFKEIGLLMAELGIEVDYE